MKTGPPTSASPGVRSASRVLDILDVVRDADGGVSLSQIAAATGLPKSSAFRYLETLEARNYVERDSASGTYLPGLALLPRESREVAVLARRARPLLLRLRDEFGETVNLGILDGTRVRYVEIVESQRAIRFAAQTGGRDFIHSTALGKAIAAQLDEADVAAILDREGMPQLTVRTIVDRDRFADELRLVRKRGFAVDDGENEEGGRCVAVAIAIPSPRAAVSLSAPAGRLAAEHVESVAATLIRATRSIADEIARDALLGAGGTRR